MGGGNHAVGRCSSSGGSNGCKGVASAFFSGKIRDKTTKESRKAAENLALITNQRRNPCLQLLNAKGAKVNLNNIDVAKAQVQVQDKLPEEVVRKISETVTECTLLSQEEASTAGSKRSRGSASFSRNPMEEEVRRDILRRIEALGKAGKAFEDTMPYTQNSERDAADAECIVRGIDPATVNGTGGYARGSYVQRRKIPVERRHWVACKSGHYLTPYGVAYVHTDGSIALFKHGQANECRCGAVHMA